MAGAPNVMLSMALMAQSSVSVGDCEHEPALTGLYREHAPSVERWVRRLVGSREDVEDLKHDVFVTAFRRMHSYDPERGELSAWLFGITNKVVRGHLRRDWWRAHLRGTRPCLNEDASGDGASPPSPIDLIERRADLDQLYRLLDQLKVTWRTALVLHDLEGLSCEAIAQRQGTTLENVYVRVHRGRRRLAELWTQARS